jgi:hypothetical protein
MLTFLKLSHRQKGGKGKSLASSPNERHGFENRMRTGRERRKLPSGSGYNECRICVRSNFPANVTHLGQTRARLEGLNGCCANSRMNHPLASHPRVRYCEGVPLGPGQSVSPVRHGPFITPRMYRLGLLLQLIRHN